MDIVLEKGESETVLDYKVRCLRTYILYIQDQFSLSHTFEVLHIDRSINESDIPSKGSVLSITGDEVHYYYVPYQEPGSPKVSQYSLSSIYEFIDGPLKTHLITKNASYDLVKVKGLPTELKDMVEHLEELKLEIKLIAKQELDALKQDKDESQTDTFINYLGSVESIDFNPFECSEKKRKELAGYAMTVYPLAKQYFTEQLLKLSQSEITGKINKICFCRKV